MYSEEISGEVNEPGGSGSVDEPTSSKRAGEEIEEEATKRKKVESPSIQVDSYTSCSDSEAAESCHDEEVANDARDMLSSDTESVRSEDTLMTNLTSNDTAEYEIASTDQEIQRLLGMDDSSEEGFQNFNAHLREFPKRCNFQSTHLDAATFGGPSEAPSTSPTSNSDVDPGLPRNDYLDFKDCLLCKTTQKNSNYPLCKQCFLWRKNLFPAPPKKKKRLLYSTTDELEPVIEIISTSELPSSKNGNISEEQNSSNSGLSDTVIDNKIDKPSTSSSIGQTSTCQICYIRPESGLFVHANSAHLYGCYKCAKKAWFGTGFCPICRRKVQNVTKLQI